MAGTYTKAKVVDDKKIPPVENRTTISFYQSECLFI